MKTILSLFTIALLSINSYSQQFKNMTIFKNDNTQIKVSGILMYEGEFIKDIRFKKTTSNLNNITKVIVDEEIYLVKDYGWEKYLFQQISNGKLSLFKGKNNYYIENSKFGLKEILKKEHVKYPVFKTGTVSLFINNCKLAVNKLEQNATNLTLENLKNIINIYNSCDLEKEIQIADKVMAKSMKPSEKIKIGLSVGFMNLKTDFKDVLNAPAANTSHTSIGAKIYFHSNMLDKNLDFNVSVDYFMEGKQKTSSSDYTLFGKTKFIKTMIGTNYIFNSISTIVKPYVGISGGFIFNSNSSLLLIPKTEGLPLKKYDVNNELAYNINAGTILYILNQKIDLLIEYQPSLDMSLIKKTDINEIKSSYNITGLNFRLTYIF